MGIDEGRREKAKGNDAHRTDDEKLAITLLANIITYVVFL